jgi:hypothetical protein
MNEYLEYTVKKRKATRISYRMVGVVFFVLGALLIVWGIISNGVNGGNAGRIVKMAFGLALLAYGFSLVKSSFRRSAYDTTYIFEEEGMRIKQERWEKLIPYSELTNVNLVIPDPDMAYYILKIDRGGANFVLPFSGKRDKCDAIYEFMLKKLGIDLPEK